MIDEIIQLAISNGLWAVLFVFLFLYQIKDGKKRESKYISIIDQLSIDVAIVKKIDTQIGIVHSNILSIKRIIGKNKECKSEV